MKSSSVIRRTTLPSIASSIYGGEDLIIVVTSARYSIRW